MNRLRSFAVVFSILGSLLGSAHAETEAQMRARAAAEISRQATAAEVEALTGRALLAATDPKLVPDRDELLRRFDALDLPSTSADWSALLAGRAWPKTAR